MAPILWISDAEPMGMSTADGTAFNPSLGLAWRGMWGISFATTIVEATSDEPDDDEPAEAPAA